MKLISVLVVVFLLFSPCFLFSQDIKDPITLRKLECDSIIIETSSVIDADDAISDHLRDRFPILSDEWLGNITSTGKVNMLPPPDSFSLSIDIGSVTYKVPKSFLVDTAKILWELNIPEFRSYLYQLYNQDTIFIDIWNNVVGTAKDKTYEGYFEAYRIRNWPSWKDPEKPESTPTPPGPKNPLGLFVVHYDRTSLRYFHGTNKNHLIYSKMRNLSHGCVRNDNDNIKKMKEFIIKRIIKNDNLQYWLSSKKTLSYDLKANDIFPVRVIYKTFSAFRDNNGPYIELYKDIYSYGRTSKYSKQNQKDLIVLTNTENIFTEYKKNIRDNKISDEKLKKIIEYVISKGKLYERYYVKDIESYIEPQEEFQEELPKEE
ncbi:MAG: L,D-transpeptidase [Ignavibacteria bacterium]|nr:L,D-transpeptidase [Ignavibacteria bacterium]